ncbi:MAG TPA: hypothetical protein VGN51_18150 [Acidimicrobiia bacterium]|jgi:hypothetical protein
MAAGTDDGRTTPGTDVVPRAMPVPAPPPGVTDVLRRSAQLGLGAIGLAGRAAGSVFARVPDPGGDAPDAEPGIAALLPGAVLGIAIEAEKRASAVVDSMAAHSTGVVRAVGKPAIVQRALRPLEDRLWHWNELARREQHRNQAQASALIPVIVQQVTENVIAQLDFVRIVEQIPIDDIAASIDVEAIVQRIDLGGVIRESTASLTMETVDAVRSQGIGVDEWTARVVDRVLLRKRPRNTGFDKQ